MDVVKEDKKEVFLGDVSADELKDILALFIYTIRRLKVCGNPEVTANVVYYEYNLANSGMYLSGAALKSNNVKDGVHYFLSCSTEGDESVRQFVNFDANNQTAVVTTLSRDVSTMINASKYLAQDYRNILRKIEFSKD